MTSADYPLPIAQLFPVQIFGIASPDKVVLQGPNLRHGDARPAPFLCLWLCLVFAVWAEDSRQSGEQQRAARGTNPAGEGDANAMRALLALTGSCQTCLLSAPKHTSHVAAVRGWLCRCFNEQACLDDGKKVGPVGPLGHHRCERRPASAKGSGVSGEGMQPAQAKCANRPTPEQAMDHLSLIAPLFPARAQCCVARRGKMASAAFFLMGWRGLPLPTKTSLSDRRSRTKAAIPQTAKRRGKKATAADPPAQPARTRQSPSTPQLAPFVYVEPPPPRPGRIPQITTGDILFLSTG
ncbi:hypothetical protein NA56DRAFT_700936 [Hyaloscypha hepaticicola]|uniref:Uncharacterized protein n=1 Tax=Hyaloscypha hepaticicola TaxID=2082293 RepID=A0A2J6QBB8_9HELO|nr:hypothetical protein NA56DRAFT_700936 [Hyaloscypha hepaticicola]